MTMLKHVAIMLLLGFLLTSCASAPITKEASRRYTWPQGSDEPRIEWIGVYGNSKQLKKGGPSLFTKMVGEEDSVQLDRPVGIASDGKGSVYVTDIGKGRVLRFNFPKREVQRPGGEDLNNSLQRPFGISVDSESNIYIADDYARKIYVVSPEGKILRILGLSEHVTGMGFFAVDKVRKRLIIPDHQSHKVVVTDLKGELLFTIGKPGSGNGEFNRPNAAAVESDGTIVVADSFNARIQRFSPDGGFKSKFGRRGDGLGDFSLIKGVAVDSQDHIYVTDGRLNRITVYSRDGVGLMTFGDTRSETLNSAFAIGGFLVPQGIYIDQDDRIFIADQYNNRFQVFQYLNPEYLRQFPLSGPARPLLDPDDSGR